MILWHIDIYVGYIYVIGQTHYHTHKHTLETWVDDPWRVPTKEHLKNKILVIYFYVVFLVVFEQKKISHKTFLLS
jgi:hypothetical protein